MGAADSFILEAQASCPDHLKSSSYSLLCQVLFRIIEHANTCFARNSSRTQKIPEWVCSVQATAREGIYTMLMNTSPLLLTFDCAQCDERRPCGDCLRHGIECSPGTGPAGIDDAAHSSGQLFSRPLGCYHFTASAHTAH